MPWRTLTVKEQRTESVIPARKPGTRSLPTQLSPVEYPGDDFVRKVQQGGWVSFQGKALRTSKALAGQPVALRPVVGEDGVFALYFCHQFVEECDLRNAG